MASDAAKGRLLEAAMSNLDRQMSELCTHVGLTPLPFKAAAKDRDLRFINTLNNLAMNLATINGMLGSGQDTKPDLAESKATTPRPKPLKKARQRKVKTDG